MEFIYGLLIGLGVGGVGGYMLATHIHAIAATAAKDATTVINKAAAAVNPPPV